MGDFGDGWVDMRLVPELWLRTGGQLETQTERRL